MLDGEGRLVFDGDHVDVSFNRADTWPIVLFDGTIKSMEFKVGDPDVGPTFQLGWLAPAASEWDWEHGIDPMHYHGSDQFRVILDGEWTLARHPLPAPEFAFQESGRVYEERPKLGHGAWIVLVIGDRRGGPATLTREGDKATFAATFEGEYESREIDGVDRPREDGEDYPHPAGPKGIPAVATSVGPCTKGYEWGSFDDTDAWASIRGDVRALSGVLGDREAGPAVFAMKGEPGATIAPRTTVASETVWIVAEGSCRIGDTEYVKGDMRVQQQGAPQEPVLSGPDGVRLVLVVADRRGLRELESADPEGSDWVRDMEDVYAAIGA